MCLMYCLSVSIPFIWITVIYMSPDALDMVLMRQMITEQTAKKSEWSDKKVKAKSV